MSPFLSYSGRGGSHRGRGRGGGRGSAGRGRGRGRGRGGGRTTYVRASTTTETTSYTGRAGRSGDDLRGATTNKHQWIRQPKLTETEGINADGGDGSITVNRQPEATSKQKNKSTDHIATAVPDQYSHAIMKKNGLNQLVLSSKTIRSDDVASISVVSAVSEEQQQQQKQAAAGQTLTREGKHKLVSLATATATTTKTPAGKTQKPPPMNHRSNNYLYNSFRGHQNSSSRVGGVGNSTKLVSSSTNSRHAAKRVKLSVLPSSKTEEKDTIGKDNSKDVDGKNKNNEDLEVDSQELLTKSQCAADAEKETDKDTDTKQPKPKPTEKLTDFAYRETSQVRQRTTIPSRNLQWSKKTHESSNNISDETLPPPPTCITDNHHNKRRKNKNMGLVRVQPDEKTTPICPTFLRGLQCQNQYCRKRHDIPKEYAVPVCSFFQRHGQCLRGETCVFRHVKVNAKAVVCPSFALLGFCEDEHCTMQHVNVRGTGTGTGSATTTRTREESSRTTTKPKSNVYYRNRSSGGSRTTSTRNNHQR